MGSQSFTTLGLAALGGFLWAFGTLGKRVGVQGCPNEEKQLRASLTIFVYTLTTLITPTLDFIRIGGAAVSETFHTPEWNHRIPWIVLCGVISGLGGLLGTLAFAWAAGSSSALISMVENGTYTMLGAIIIAVAYLEHPAPSAYIACVLIMGGVLLAQASSSKKPVPEEKVLTDSESEAREEADSAESSGSEADNHVCGTQNDWGSENEVSVQAPTRLRKRAVLLAVLAGAGWAFGPLGKKMGVHESPDGKKHAWTACTYFIYMLSTNVVPLFRVLFTSSEQRRQAFSDSSFRWLLLGTMACGLVSGCGGLVSTYAFSREGGVTGALISMVENGVYTVFGALLIALTFREKPSLQQLLSAALVLAGILVSGIR